MCLDTVEERIGVNHEHSTPSARDEVMQRGLTELGWHVDRMPRNVRVIHGLGPGLDDKAVEAVNQWRFKPGEMDGQPVPVAAHIEINFRLK